jgi:hypothetical protein
MSTIAEMKTELAATEDAIRSLVHHKNDLSNRLQLAEAATKELAEAVASAEKDLNHAIVNGMREEEAQQVLEREQRAFADANRRLEVLRGALRQAEDPSKRSSLDQKAVRLRRRIFCELALEEIRRLPKSAIVILERAHAFLLMGSENLVDPTLRGSVAALLADHNPTAEELKAIQEELQREHGLGKFRP